MADDPQKRAKKKAGHALDVTRETYEEARSAGQSTFRIEGVEDEKAMNEVKINHPKVNPDKRNRHKGPD